MSGLEPVLDALINVARGLIFILGILAIVFVIRMLQDLFGQRRLRKDAADAVAAVDVVLEAAGRQKEEGKGRGCRD